MLNDKQLLEEKIQSKDLNAPRLTPAHIDGTIRKIYYHVVPETTLTLCVLTLQNGFTVVGQSAAASKENFDEEIGKEIAFKQARDQIWMLEGYLLRERLHWG